MSGTDSIRVSETVLFWGKHTHAGNRKVEIFLNNFNKKINYIQKIIEFH